MKQISFEQLQAKQDQGVQLQLIDVREEEEHRRFNIGGELIPLGEITRKIESIARDRPVVFYCRKGVRSQIAIQRLCLKFSDGDFYNLQGGISNLG